ncbi:holo-ACP synthase [Thermovenabulum sp.]|uniref:holo-ACP synthase n=1 Tax=Thermovenabulum sp. TaxID=3100335 RepID=UPI003C7A8C94
MGVGIDIVEVERVKRACKNKRFLKKIFTDKEINSFNENKFFFQSVAARFAAKEAVAKALGTGIGEVSWRDIEILKDEKGKPRVFLYGKAKDRFLKKGFKLIDISLSHTKEYACAVACIMGGLFDESGNAGNHEENG